MEEIRGAEARANTTTSSPSSLYPLPSPPIDPTRHVQMSTGTGAYRQHHHQRQRHDRKHSHKPECTCFRHLSMTKLCFVVLKKNPRSKKQLNGGSEQQPDDQQELSFMSYTTDDMTKPNNSGLYNRENKKKKSKFKCFKLACPRLPKKITCCCTVEPSRMSSAEARNLTTGTRAPPTSMVRPPIRNASMITMVSSSNMEPAAVLEQPIVSRASLESIHIELIPDHEPEPLHEEEQEQRGTARKSVHNSVRTSVRNSVRNSVRTSVRSSKEVAETDDSDLCDSSDYVEIIDRQESEHDEEDDEGELEILLEEQEWQVEQKEKEYQKREAERKERKYWAGKYNEGFGGANEIVEEEKKENEKEAKKERKMAERKLGGGSLNDAVYEVVERFTESVTKEADELYMHDILGSRAHVKMLAAMVR